MSKALIYAFVLIYSFAHINIYLFLYMEKISFYYIINLYITEITIDKEIEAIEIAKTIWFIYFLATPFVIRGIWNDKPKTKVLDLKTDKQVVQKHV